MWSEGSTRGIQLALTGSRLMGLGRGWEWALYVGGGEAQDLDLYSRQGGSQDASGRSERRRRRA